MITSRDTKFIVIGILIFLISRYLYDRFLKPQKRTPRRKQRVKAKDPRFIQKQQKRC